MLSMSPNQRGNKLLLNPPAGAMLALPLHDTSVPDAPGWQLQGWCEGRDRPQKPPFSYTAH